MKRIFVYEFLSGNSRGDEDTPLLAEGIAMRDALVADLRTAAEAAIVQPR